MPDKTLAQVPPGRKTQQQPAETPHDRVGYLADGRLKAEGEGPTSHIDAINYLLNRGEGLVEIIKEACQSETGCQFPKDYLLSVLDILREDVEVARRIADQLDDLYRKPATAKAD